MRFPFASCAGTGPAPAAAVNDSGGVGADSPRYRADSRAKEHVTFSPPKLIKNDCVLLLYP